jgi:hypothetical protein
MTPDNRAVELAAYNTIGQIGGRSERMGSHVGSNTASRRFHAIAEVGARLRKPAADTRPCMPSRSLFLPTQNPTDAGGFLGPLLLGAVSQRSGGYGPALGLLGACLGAATAMVLLLSETWARGGPWRPGGAPACSCGSHEETAALLGLKAEGPPVPLNPGAEAAAQPQDRQCQEGPRWRELELELPLSTRGSPVRRSAGRRPGL